MFCGARSALRAMWHNAASNADDNGCGPGPQGTIYLSIRLGKSDFNIHGAGSKGTDLFVCRDADIPR
jgi:hypothetical protein